MLLLVDDQAFIGEAVRRAIGSEPDIDFHFCSRASEALSVAEDIHPTVILQDLVMPGADGLDLIRAYRKSPVTQDTPVIALSVRDDATTKSEAFSAGANDYLIKLPDRVELLARVRYHGAAYNAQCERDEAIRALRDSEQRLASANASLTSLNQRLEDATRAKSEFLAMMSHEVRTPLNGVLGFADLLLESQLNEDQRLQAETISSSGRALLTVLNDILDFSKIEAGKLHLEQEAFDLGRCVRSTCALFEPRALEHGTQILLRMDPMLPRRIAGDEIRLQQILGNLLSNAVKFTRNGRITVTAEPGTRRELKAWRSDPDEDGSENGNLLLRISVCDTGPGVPADRRERLFKTFSQINSSDARSHGGTGLGLAICRKLAQLMGGDIWFRPTDEGGSDFIFIIPVGAAQESPSKPDEVLLFGGNIPPDKEKLHRAKVLVAEDNRVNAMLILALLGKEGIHAQHVKNGALAVEAVESQPYDLIFMDLQMPEMDGIEATRAIRARQRDGERPPTYIVALTAEAMAGDREKCQQAGMDDYLPKPLRPAELQAALQRFTSKYNL